MPAGDGRRWSRRAATTGILGLAATACSKLAFVAANVPAAFGPYRRHTDIAYGSLPEHRLDVYLPDPPVTEKMPMIVFWYGGRWTTGDKSDYRFVGAALAALGCIAVLPNYRHYPKVKIAGFMDDGARALLWAAQHAVDFAADPGRLYLMGHSSGAHIAALIALDNRYFQALGQPAPPVSGVIGLSGPYDFLPLTDADLQDMFGPPERYEDSQPIHFVHPGAPPMLLVHGLSDSTVLPKNSINFASTLRGAGCRVSLRLYPKLGHADTVAALSVPARGRAPTLADVAMFLKEGV